MKEKYSEQGRNPYDGIRFYSALTHGVGIVLALLALAVLLTITVHRSALTVTAVSVYAVSMLCLYTASTVYHSLNTSIRGRLLLRKLDHLMIYFLIAGTYTPVCLISMNGMLSGRIMLIVVWSMALLGSAFTLFWIRMPRALTAVIYLVMGWTAIFAIYPLHTVMTPICLLRDAARRRDPVFHRRRTVRAEVAGPQQQVFRMPRNLPCIHCTGQYRPLCHDLSNGSITRQKSGWPAPPAFSRS